MSDDYGYFGQPGHPIPPPPAYPPPPPSGPVALAELSAHEQAMLRDATTTSYTQMGTGRIPRPGHYPLGSKMSFGQRLSSGLDLAKTCWAVLRDEPVLLLVPFVATVVSALVFGVWYVLTGGGPPAGSNRAVVAVYLFPLTLCVAIIGTVSNAVLVSAATTRLEGLAPELGKCWAKALSRLPQLIGFAVILVVERAITNALRNQKLFGGGLAANVIDRAWDFASFLAIPVILYEGAQPFRAVTRSGELVASRWGTQLTARGVLSIAVTVVALPLLLGLALLGFAFSPIAGIVLLVIGIVGVSAVSAALSGILSAAMYRFATTGLVVPGFREADMWRVFSRA